MGMTHISDIHQLLKLLCFNSGAQVSQSHQVICQLIYVKTQYQLLL